MLMNSVEPVGSNDDFTTYLDGSIRQHQGWMALEAFGQLLSNKALDERALKYFLASTACFFREIPGGILALALRVTDDRIDNELCGASQAVTPQRRWFCRAACRTALKQSLSIFASIVLW